MRSKRAYMMLAFVVGALCVTDTALASKSSPTTRPADVEVLRAKAAPAIAKALKFQAERQNEDGGWEGMFGGSDPAISALVAKSFIQHPDYGPNHEIARRAVKFVMTYAQDDGGIYKPEIGYRNYTTSIGLMCLASTGDADHRRQIRDAQKFLKSLQWTEDKCDNDGKPITSDHPWYGGAGYGRGRRPDLSNTQMMLEALHQSGLPADDPAYRKAMTFVTRCQMREASNDQPFARGATDGGFIYTPANQGESKASPPDGDKKVPLRSYGSMTYAGFKSMLYADLSRDDPRVRAAWDWIRGNYTLDANPNMPGKQAQEGLYYYYHVFARGLDAWGEPFITEPAGTRHDWRAELVAALLKRQKPDGSWINEADRWHEGNAHLVTAYSVLALQAALNPARPTRP